MKIALVCPPFASRRSPSLGLGILKSVLVGDGHAVAVHYVNLYYAALIGIEAYDPLSDGICPEQSEHLFGECLFPGRLQEKEFVAAVSKQMDPGRYESLIRFAQSALDAMAKVILAGSPELIGISSTLLQRMPALALAKRLKELSPQTPVIMGGADYEKPMGLALLRHYTFLDAAFHGEAERSLLTYVNALSVGFAGTPVINGVSRRDFQTGQVLEGGSSPAVSLDAIPSPDFDDYVVQTKLYDIGLDDWVLPFEISRGCWWGQKHHCTFCGLNGAQMQFRSKTIERACTHLQVLSKRYGSRQVAFTDNIAPADARTTLLPALAALSQKSYFFETKANLTSADLVALKASRVNSIQPGIERLNSQVLKSMRKGVSARQNVQLLRWATEYGIDIQWNILLGFPGEQSADLQAELQLVRQLIHLQPPVTCTMIRIDRFSPMFNNPSAFGIRLTGVLGRDRWTGLPDCDEGEAAYFFSYEFTNPIDERNRPMWERITFEVSKWRRGYRPNSFTYEDRGSAVVILDHRDAAYPREIELTGHLASTFLHFDRTSARADKGNSELTALEEAGLVLQVDDVPIVLPTRRHYR